MLIETHSHQRPDFIALVIDQENCPALCSRLSSGELQNDVQQFRKIERGIQTLGSFDYGGEFDNRIATFAAFQRNLRVSPEQIQPDSRFFVERLFQRRLKNTNRISLASQEPRAALSVLGGSFASSNFFYPGQVRCRKLTAFLPDRRCAIDHAPEACAVEPAGRRQHAHHLRSEVSRLDFGVQNRYNLLESLQSRRRCYSRSCLPLHPLFPLY